MNAQTISNFADRLVGWTEVLLTHRARRIEKKKRKQKKRGVVIEWLDAFLWAVMVVLLLNQYLLQAYQIPSGSMRPTLIGGIDPYSGQRSTSDRIFVDKITFGPEALPGLGKIKGFRESRRGEVIIFENPEYDSPSLAHEITQRILYMVTLSMVDLNRQNGETAHQFLIKRQVAEDGDTVNFRRGFLSLKNRGEQEFIPEEDFKALSGLEYENRVLLNEGYYEKQEAALELLRLEDAGLPLSADLKARSNAPWVSSLKKTMRDLYAQNRVDMERLEILYPQNEAVSRAHAAYEQGIYVPEGWVLPLGDNRSDSGDGRYFGPIPQTDVLGRALFLYWPLGRAGVIR
ncbi:MAG: S26 family signal peptidase [Spirochaetales bacterium]|nr:S26 family signal peptidase [Spirochaetales bacterium]